MPVRYQIQVSGSWATVTVAIFRSWTGRRRIIDTQFVARAYHGPVYNLWFRRYTA